MPKTASERQATSPRQHWELAVLCLLRERPMHPYEMRQVMRHRHKDERLFLRPGSLYNAVASLLDQGLIEALETNRQGRRPNRTIYRITPAGEPRVTGWIVQLLGEIRRDVSSFAVALDHLVHVEPGEAIPALERRRNDLATAIAEMADKLVVLVPRIGRINLIEVEHDLALARAQHEWLGRIVEEIRAGTLQWSPEAVIAEARQAAASGMHPPTERVRA